MPEMIKYPRTPHLEGSRKQASDEDLDAVPFDAIRGRFVVVEEKMLDDLMDLIGPSLYKSAAWKQRLAEVARERGIDPAQAARETDGSDHMEGLYIKVEEDGRTVERYKFIRAGFLNTILDSGTH